MKVLKYSVVQALSVLVLGSLVSCSSHERTTKHLEISSHEAWEVLSDADREPAADNCKKPARDKSCKMARQNDAAQEYMLGHDGTFRRRINGVECAITSKVQDFKISQHPTDAAVVYYRKNNNLYMINQDREFRQAGNCPSVQGNTKLLMSNVKKYSVTSDLRTTIVNAALSNDGQLVAWDYRIPVYRDYGVSDYNMNNCYNVKGKSFSSVVLFSIDYSGKVSKVRNAKGLYQKIGEANSTHESYRDINDFKISQNVCN